MLRFKQFISEDMPYLDDEYEQSKEDKTFRAADLRQRLKSLDAAKGDTPLKKIGEIGPYEVHHVPTEMAGLIGGHIYRQHHAVVTHKGNRVGVVTFSEEKPGFMDLPKHLVSQHPLFQLSHSGRKARVSGLPSHVYRMISQHLNMPVVSGARQSRGGQNVWKNLAKMGKVSALNTRTGERIHDYDPDKPEHHNIVYSSTSGGGYQSGYYWLLMHHPEQPKKENP
jgi:hypothetical protein